MEAASPSPYPRPTPILGIKLSCIARHCEAAMGGEGHALDVEAIRGLLADPEVSTYMAELDALALLPVPR